MYYFYILKRQKNNKLYLGYTPNNPFAHLTKHNQGLVRATKPYIPYKLICFIAFENKDDAIACEKYIRQIGVFIVW
jgi:putative endonuclease